MNGKSVTAWYWCMFSTKRNSKTRLWCSVRLVGPRIANLGHLKQLTWLDLSFNNIRLSTHPVDLSRCAKVSWVCHELTSRMMEYYFPDGAWVDNFTSQRPLSTPATAFLLASWVPTLWPTTSNNPQRKQVHLDPAGLKNLKSRWSNDAISRRNRRPGRVTWTSGALEG